MIVAKSVVARYKKISRRARHVNGVLRRIRSEVRDARVVTVQELKGKVDLSGCCCNSRPREFRRFENRIYVVERDHRGQRVVRTLLQW